MGSLSLSLGYIRADWLTGLALTTSRELRPATGVSQWFQDLPPVFLLLCVLPTTQTSQVSLSLFLTQVSHRIRIIFFPFHPGKKNIDVWITCEWWIVAREARLVKTTPGSLSLLSSLVFSRIFLGRWSLPFSRYYQLAHNSQREKPHRNTSEGFFLFFSLCGLRVTPSKKKMIKSFIPCCCFFKKGIFFL